jgi:hypothetical protein
MSIRLERESEPMDGEHISSWSGRTAEIPSYLGGRTQGVTLEHLDDGSWLARSSVASDVDEDGALRDEVAEILDRASRRFPAIHFRLREGRLEAYCRLDGAYPATIESDTPRLSELDRRMIVYLAHVADRLEFEIHEGEDLR